jgi:hypothetical protein
MTRPAKKPERVPAWQLWTEKQWMEEVRKLANQLGWLTFHPHHSQRSQPGFPDLTLVRDRVIFAELKRHHASAKLSPHQRIWRDRLILAGAEYYEWRPAQAQDIARILSKRSTA